jgi:hypothetical protein
MLRELQRRGPRFSLANSSPAHPVKDHTASWIAVSSIAASIAAGFSGWAAYETRSSAVETARATQATVWMQLMSDYAQPEMYNAMKELRTWQQAHPKDFAGFFTKLLVCQKCSPKDIELRDRLDRSRRTVGHLFNKVKTLSQLGIINESDIVRGWDRNTYAFYASVLVPMELAKGDAMFLSNLFSLADKEGDAFHVEDNRKFFDRTTRARSQ